jgi:hypothetical protein
MKEKKGLKANDIVHKLLKELDKMNVPLVRTVWKLKFYGAFVLNRRVLSYAIDATPEGAGQGAVQGGRRGTLSFYGERSRRRHDLF